MNYKYTSSKLFTQEQYYNLNMNTLKKIYSEIRKSLNFKCEQCIFIYSKDNAIITQNAESLPLYLNIQSTDSFAFSFDSNETDSLTVEFTPCKITVTVTSSAADSQIAKDFADSLFTYEINKSESNHNSINRNKKKRNNVRFYKSAIFWTAIGIIFTAIIAVIDFIFRAVFHI